MTTEEKKEILRSYRWKRAAAKQLLNKLREIEAEALPRAIAYDGMPKGGEPKDMSGWAARVDAMERKLQKAYEEEIDALHRITAAINEMNDTLQKSVLWMRYVEMKSVEKIARELHYAEKTIWNAHRLGIRAIKFTEAPHENK